MAKRVMDLVIALAAMALLGLPMLLIALAIRLDSSGPALFRQQRVGQGGGLFSIHKFRTMVADAPALGPGLTVGDDPRITRIGRFLRRSKLDELPQLIDVISGDMSLVGPRPELPQYVARYPQALRERALALKPGITDPVSLDFADESELLSSAADPEREYVEVILPRKLRAALDYAERATLVTDLKVIARTLGLLARRATRRRASA